MSWLTLGEVGSMTGGVLYGKDAAVDGVSIDSRALQAQELFVALRGEKFDGHDFLEASREHGASGALVERRIDVPLPQILVEDTFEGLLDLAAAWRRRCSPTMIALTGSNGKTTTRMMIVEILKRRRKVLATRGNLNNHIGVPLTLLALREPHQAAVIEIGANYSGEVAHLGKAVRPGVAVVLNAGAAHLQGFGSIEGVARAKGELFDCLPDDGVGIVNADDAYCEYWRDVLRPKRTISFGLDAADVDVGGRVLLDQVLIIVNGETRQLRLQLLGRHNLCNSLAAAAVAHSLGVGIDDTVAGLEAVRAVPGRLCPVAGIAGAQLIDDTYNANPDSLAAGLELLAEHRGERWFVLGDMAELGDDAERLHAEAGRLAARRKVSRLFALGDLSKVAAAAFGEGGEWFASCAALLERLVSRLHESDASDLAILIKGSRSSRMERVVQGLTARSPGVSVC